MNILTQVRTFSRIYKKNLIRRAYHRNPESLMDEALVALWVLLLIAALFTVGFGAYYHYSMLKAAFGIGAISVTGSFLIFIVIEITKIFFGLHFLRSIIFALWYKSFYHLLYTAALGCIVVLSFAWSIQISTKGVSEVNESLKRTKMFENEVFTPPIEISSIDQQISDLEATAAQARKSTWKGRPTAEGLAVLEEATKTKQELLKQRSTLLKAAQARHDSLVIVKGRQISSTATLLATYGGKAEYATMLLLVMVVLFEAINFQNNKDVIFEPEPLGKDVPRMKQH